MKRIFQLPLMTAALLSLGIAVSCASTTVSSSTTPATSADTTESNTTSAASTETTETAQAVAALSVFAEDGIAIRGADPVAYFTEEAYVPGTDEFTHEWQGATWQFATAENRDTFASNPDQYAPEYGGFCAWAVSQGYTAPIDPTAWKIVDGKLYLNYDAGVQKRWARDIPGNIAQADENWPGVLSN